MSYEEQSTPVYRDHNKSHIIGHSQSIDRMAIDQLRNKSVDRFGYLALVGEVTAEIKQVFSSEKDKGCTATLTSKGCGLNYLILTSQANGESDAEVEINLMVACKRLCASERGDTDCINRTFGVLNMLIESGSQFAQGLSVAPGFDIEK